MKKEEHEAQRLAAAAKEAEQRRVAASIADGSMSVTQMSDGRLVATGVAGGEEIHLENDHLEAVQRVAKDVKVTLQPAAKKATKKKKSVAQGGSPKETPAVPTSQTFTLSLKSVVSNVPTKQHLPTGSAAETAPNPTPAPLQSWALKGNVARTVEVPLISTRDIQASRKSGLKNLAKRLKDNKQKHGAVLDIIGALVKLVSDGGPDAIAKELATGKQTQDLIGSIKPMVAMLKESPGHLGVLMALGLLKFGGKSTRVAQELSKVIPLSFDNYAGAVLATRAFFEIAEENKQPPKLDDDGDPIEHEEPDGMPPDQLHLTDASAIIARRAKRGRTAQAQLKYLMTGFASSKAIKLSGDHTARASARVRTLGDKLDLCLLRHQKIAADAEAGLAATLTGMETSDEATEVSTANAEVDSLKAQLADLMTQRNEMDAEAAQLKEKVFRTDARLPSVKTELEKTKQQKDELAKWLRDLEDEVGVGKWLEEQKQEQEQEPPVDKQKEAESDESEVEDAEEEMKANKKRGSFLRRAGKKSVSAPLQVSKKEEARRLNSVQTKIGSQANVANDGAEVDPERQIGHIGSQYVPEAVVPEWMKKRVSKASF